MSAAHNLACSLRLAGDCFAASDLDHDTLERRLCVLGSGHPYTLGSAANLARDMREAGAFRDSADVLRGTWQKYRTVLGDEIIHTLRAAASLAISLRKTGELSEARNFVPGHLRAHQAALRPRIAGCAVLRAEPGLRLRGHPRQFPARELAAEVRSSYLSSVGESHPFTLAAASNLAICLHGVGEDASQCG